MQSVKNSAIFYFFLQGNISLFFTANIRKIEVYPTEFQVSRGLLERRDHVCYILRKDEFPHSVTVASNTNKHVLYIFHKHGCQIR